MPGPWNQQKLGFTFDVLLCYLEHKNDVTSIVKLHIEYSPSQYKACWLSSRNFFRGGKIYCYANLFSYANFSFVFGPNFGGGKLPQGVPCGRKSACDVISVFKTSYTIAC